MEHQLHEFLEFLSQSGNYKEIKSHIAKRSHMIKQAAVIVHQESTLLLSELRHINKFAVSIALLAVQLDCLPDTAQESFHSAACSAFLSADDASIVQYFHAEVAAVSHFIVEMSCATQKPQMIVAPVLHICQHITRKPTELTSIHSDVLQTMVAAKQYFAALSFLSQCTSITEIDPSYTSLDAKHFLTYYYYASLVYISYHRYSDAAAMLDMAITAPASVISSIVVQCFKAAMLVSLIHTGNIYSAPMSASACVKQLNTQTAVAPYVAISQAYLLNDLTSLLNVIHAHTAALESDHFFGLAMQTVAALRRKKLRQLSCTYRTLSLTEVTRFLELDNVADTCACIEKLVMNGTICAGIDEISGVVTFKEMTDNANHLQLFMHELRQKLALTHDMSERLRTLQAEIFTSQAYLVKSLVSTSSTESSIMRGVIDDYDVMDYADEKY